MGEFETVMQTRDEVVLLHGASQPVLESSEARAENRRSKVAYVKGFVKFIFKRVFWEPKGVGRGGSALPTFCPCPPPCPPPPPATLHMFLADKCEETFDLVVFFLN